MAIRTRDKHIHIHLGEEETDDAAMSTTQIMAGINSRLDAIGTKARVLAKREDSAQELERIYAGLGRV